MTKFILHGGASNEPLEGNKRFFAEITSGFSSKAKVLVVYFARDEKDWLKFFEQDKENFLVSSEESKVELEMADPDPNIFREQIKSADAIYVRGGDTFKLLEKIKQFPDFADLIKDKVYAGSSAGMYLVSKYFYENDYNRIGNGLGILAIKSLAHWKEGMENIEQRLKDTGEDLPIYKVAEGEFVNLEN